MTQYVHRTMIVPASLVSLARNLASFLAGPPGDGMWTTGLSASGAGEPTHYVSSGMIEYTFADLIVDADMLWAAIEQAREAGVQTEGVTKDMIETLVRDSDVTDDPPFDAFARLGLSLTTEPDDEL